jgi:DNA-binding PadR family transcriptional regulator
MTDPRHPKDLLPLTPAMFHVLVALSDEDRHGYAIIKDVSTRTSGAVELGTGTLYGIIKRLLADGLAVESARRPPRVRKSRRVRLILAPRKKSIRLRASGLDVHGGR